MFLLVIVLAACTPTQPTLHFDASGARVTGLPQSTLEELRDPSLSEARWREILPIYVGSLPKPGDDRSPVMGSWTVEGEAVVFTPRLPFVPGQTYRARFVDPGSGARLEATLRIPAPELETETEVVALRPSLDELPENALRLYLHFSAPMSRGAAHRHVHLLDDSGREVAAPFVAPEHELWDPQTTRLTLVFDPGRVKRGVGSEGSSAPLETGRSYRLVVDRSWRDARGAPLVDGFEARFRVGPPDRRPPDPQAWDLEPPRGPEAAVTLRFPEPLDPALLERLVTVHAGGAAVPGTPQVDAGGRWWSFRPAEPWTPGEARIRVDPALEDLAGNSLRRAFETTLDAPELTGPVFLKFSTSRNLAAAGGVE